MWVKLLDEPYNKELSKELLDVVFQLTDKAAKLSKEGKMKWNEFIPHPKPHGIVAQIKNVKVLPLFGIKSYEIIEDIKNYDTLSDVLK